MNDYHDYCCKIFSICEYFVLYLHIITVLSINVHWKENDCKILINSMNIIDCNIIRALFHESWII